MIPERLADAMDQYRDASKERGLHSCADDHDFPEDAIEERARMAFDAKQLQLIPVVSHVPDPSYSYDVDRVTRAARVDALVDVACRRSCDPRGHFIKRPEFAEAWWLLYREAYNETFDAEAAK